MSKLDCLRVAFLACVICTGVLVSASAQDIAEITESIGSSVALKDWDRADEGYEALYEAYQAEYGVGSGHALSLAKVLGEWKIQAYRNRLLSEAPAQTLADASVFYAELVRGIAQSQGSASEALIDPLYGQAMVEYHLFQSASRKPVSDYRGVGSEITEEEQCVASEDGGLVVNCTYVEVPSRDYLDSQASAKSEQTSLHWTAIAAALNQIALICKQNQYLLDEAEAMAHLGDYHLYGGEQSVALEFYNSAYQQLVANAEGTEWLDRLFARPTVVPSLTTSMPGAGPAPIVTQGMQLGFSVDSAGKADDIRVLDGATSSNRQLQRTVIGIISGATFRPYFDSEGVIDSKAVEI